MSADRPKSPPGRLRRALGALSAGLGLGVVFVGSAVVGTVGHINLPPSRRILVRVVDSILGTALAPSRLVAHDIRHIGLTGVDIGAFEAFDPQGERTVFATGIHARYDGIGILQHVASGDLRIVIKSAHVERGDVLIESTNGVFGIVETFNPPGPPLPPLPPGTPPGPPVRFSIEHIEVDHAHGHGAIVPGVNLDGDVNRVVANLSVGPEGVHVDVARAGVREGSLLPFPVHGVANYHLRILASKEPEKPDDMHMWMGLSGEVGSVEVEGRATIDNDVLVAHADVPRATPDQLHALLPILHPREAVSASGDLAGTIPTFSIAGRATVEGAGEGDGVVEVSGMLDATEALRVVADVHATAVDIGDFVAQSATPLTADARVRLELTDDLRISADVLSEPFEFEGQRVPAVDAFASYVDGIVDGSATIYEDGAPTIAAFSALPGEGVRFATQTDVASLRAVRRIPGTPVDGAARVRTSGSFRQGELDARVTATYTGLKTTDDFTVKSGDLSGRVTGKLDALRVDATATGSDMHAGTYDFERFDAHASGPLATPHLEAKARGDKSGSVNATGILDPARAGVRDVELSVENGGDTLTGSIARVGAGKRGGVDVEGAKLSGKNVGALEGGLQIRNQEIVGRMKGHDVDLARITRLFGIPIRVKGLANIDVDIAETKGGRKGHASIELEDGEVGALPGVSALVEARFEDHKVKADGLVRLVAHETNLKQKDSEICDGSIARIRIEEGAADLSGPLLNPKSWERAIGSAKLSAENWDLHCLAKMAPVGLVLSDVRGLLDVKLTVARDKGDRFPSVHDLAARTRGLEVAGPQSIAAEKPAWESRHVDVQVAGDLDGATGKTSANVSLFDDELITSLESTAELDLPQLFDDPDRRWETMRKTKITARLVVPRRPFAGFATLPTFITARVPPILGEVELSAFVDGSLDKPYVSVEAKGFEVAAADPNVLGDAGAFGVLADLEATASYDGEKATADVKVLHGGVDVADAHGKMALKFVDILDNNPIAWNADLTAKLVDAPLGDIPFFVDRDVSGHLSGNIAIEGIHDRPKIHADFELPDLRIGQDVIFQRGKVLVDVGSPDASQRAIAKGQVELATQDGGRFDASGFTGVVWQNGIVPAPDPESRGDVAVRAQHFRLAALHPAVMRTLSKLDGFLDGDLRLAWKKVGDEDAGSLTAQIKVTKAVVHIPQLGQEFHDAHLTIKSEPGGVLRLVELGADGARGHLGGKGHIKLDGLKLREAVGSIAILDNQDLPIALEGVPIGNLRGTFDIRATKQEHELDVDVKVPTLHLELPPAPGRGVQALDDNADVHVSHPLHAEAEHDGRAGLRYVFTFRLREAIIEGTGLKVALTSLKANPPKVTLGGDDTVVAGDIHLVSGKLIVFGKEFQIEETAPNLVHMQGDAANPYLNVTARWDSPDGTEVFIDYIGPLQPITADKIKLRSVPSYPSDQIMTALLLGGDFSQTQQAGAQQAGGVAAGVGGNLAAQQFNALLSGISPLRGFSTRVATAQDGSLQGSLVYDINDKFSATATFDNGTTGPTGSNSPGYTGYGTATTQSGMPIGGYGGTAAQKSGVNTQLSIDWHFWKNWLLRGTVGIGADDPMSGIDFLWQYRY